jgi:hypothetical protein
MCRGAAAEIQCVSVPIKLRGESVCSMHLKVRLGAGPSALIRHGRIVVPHLGDLNGDLGRGRFGMRFGARFLCLNLFIFKTAKKKRKEKSEKDHGMW